MTIRFLGQYLVEEQLISERQLSEALKLQSETNLTIGQLAVEEGLLTEVLATMVHSEQKRTDNRFGDIAVQLRFMTEEDVTHLLAEQKRRNVMLGQALVINGAMLDRQLGAVLKSFAAANKKAEQDMVRKISMFPYPKVMTECASVSTRTLQRFIFESAKAGTGAPNANLDHADTTCHLPCDWIERDPTDDIRC